MTQNGIDPTPPSWLSGSGPAADCILSSRIRLARNLRDFPFEPKADRISQVRIVDAVKETLSRTDRLPSGGFIDTPTMPSLPSRYLLERHLVSPDFAAARHPRGLFVSNDQNLSLMVNEEDHLRFQTLSSGLAFDAAFERVNELDSEVDRSLSYAFSHELGYLTACPTNVGTGMRASVLIHLPGLVLTREIEKVLRGVTQIGYSVRGLYGEGSETKGHFFQLSNQTTIGLSENDIILNLTKICQDLIRLERTGRDFLLSRTRHEIEDKVFRARALLENARVISSDETINLASAVRLGIGLGLVTDLEYRTINEILILSQPAHIQIIAGREMDESERDHYRAKFLRSRIKNPKET